MVDGRWGALDSQLRQSLLSFLNFKLQHLLQVGAVLLHHSGLQFDSSLGLFCPSRRILNETYPLLLCLKNG
jgi:hypothetical protein